MKYLLSELPPKSILNDTVHAVEPPNRGHIGTSSFVVSLRGSDSTKLCMDITSIGGSTVLLYIGI